MKLPSFSAPQVISSLMGKKEKDQNPRKKSAAQPLAMQAQTNTDEEALASPAPAAAADATTLPSTQETKPEICPVNLCSAFARFTDHWKPKAVADLNGQQVRLVKFQGEFIWHSHDHEDELFLVHRGSFVMEFRDRKVELREGEMIVIPRGVEHRPVAENEVEVILFEPAATVNTGNSSDTSRKAKVTRLNPEPNPEPKAEPKTKPKSETKLRRPAHKATSKPAAKSAPLRRHRAAKKHG